MAHIFNEVIKKKTIIDTKVWCDYQREKGVGEVGEDIEYKNEDERGPTGFAQ